MGKGSALAAARKNRKTRPSSQRQPNDVKRNAMDCSDRRSIWRDDGILEAVFHALSKDADMENLSMDSTCVKVHESANGGGKNG